MLLLLEVVAVATLHGTAGYCFGDRRGLGGSCSAEFHGKRLDLCLGLSQRGCETGDACLEVVGLGGAVVELLLETDGLLGLFFLGGNLTLQRSNQLLRSYRK